MGLRIQNNVEAFNTHRQLTATATQASKSMEKLSSGYRINRAADDAAGLGISEKMRGQIGGLAQAQRNAQDGISLVQTAEGALNEVHSMLQRVRDLKVQFDNGTLERRRQDGDLRRGARDRQGSQQSIVDRHQVQRHSAVLAHATFTFQVGANDGRDDHDAGDRLSRQHRRRRRPVRADRSSAGRRRERGASSASGGAVDDRQHRRRRSRTSPRSVATTARSRTASSTVWPTWRPTRRT